MTDPAIIEAAARALCRADSTAQCAAICLSHSASSTSDGKCPEALLMWKHKSEATITAVTPLIRAQALEEAAKVAEYEIWHSFVRDKVATAIRALKEQP